MGEPSESSSERTIELREPRFAVVDVETSGLSTSRHRILQIGLVTVDPHGAVLDEWSSLVALRWPWSRVGPRKVHGITRRSLRGAPKAEVALAELRERLDGAVFTAHNAEFDARFIERGGGAGERPADARPAPLHAAAVPPPRPRPAC